MKPFLGPAAGKGKHRDSDHGQLSLGSVLLSSVLYWHWRGEAWPGGEGDAQAGACPAAESSWEVRTRRQFESSHFQRGVGQAVWWPGIAGGVCAALMDMPGCLQDLCRIS